MIEIKKICKTYITKKGLEVPALKKVSLNFPNKGMVFVLGKSGSGKSTLLNVMGGLDSYDSGELIIKGKSSKDFKQADFDSYRNTLIGFIFQEYNILDEYTIGANIALALQLQGKKADTDTVDNILDEVDLTGYGNRKPNELSGGQIQRVAIARALIKNPDIIMADEPTGALDSNTGRQVFDTLKKLSKDKLVIIVSHDREFAEYYGDRVIEFKDGEVISDISKYEAPAIEKSEGLKIIDNKIMQVKKGYKLSAEDMDTLKIYIENSDNDSFVSLDSRTNESLKQIAMISDDGSKQSFKDTDNEEVAANGQRDGYKMIRSRLPFKHMVKMSFSSLKAKPVKLIFTIILSMVAFGLFGMADTFAAFNSSTALVSTMIDNGESHVTIGRSIYGDEHMSDEFINNLNEKIDIKAKGVYSASVTLGEINNRNKNDLAYYAYTIGGLMELNANDFKERGLNLTGRVAENANEIVITKYLFESFQKYGYFINRNESIKPNEIGSEEDFISKNLTLYMYQKSFTIVGIVDTKFNTEKYEQLKSITIEDLPGNKIYQLYRSLTEEINTNYHGLGFVANGTIEDLNDGSFGSNLDSGVRLNFDNIRSWTKIATYDMLVNSENNFVTRTEINSITDKQVILALDDFIDHLSRNISIPHDFESLKIDFLSGKFDEFLNIGYSLNYYDENQNPYGESGVKTIVGFYEPNQNQSESRLIVGNYFFNKYSWKNDNKYSHGIGIIPDTRAEVEKLVQLSESDNEKEKFFILSQSANYLYNYGDMIGNLANIFIYIGVGFSLFAALMLMNYITSSINYKKREIGILRAVGARGSDVFGIFCCESVFIALVNFALSVGVTIGICAGFNSIVRNTLYMPLTLLTFGIRQVGLIFGLSLLTALVACLIPVLKISRKRPIDAIRDK